MSNVEEAAIDVRPTDPVVEAETPENELALVKRIQATIRQDKRHHEKAFKRMRRDMYVALHGHTEEYPVGNYTANIIGRHIQQKTASLYAKNPKAIARRRETLDFTIWDENPKSLEMAMQGLEMARQAALQTPTVIDPVTGQPGPAQSPIPPEMEEAFAQAQAIVADFQQGYARRQQITKIGKTLEILFAQAMREQKPVDFKTATKQLVRRACTTGVGYCELGFQREMGPRPEMTEKLADARARLDHLQRLTQEAAAEEFGQDDAEMAELEASIRSFQEEPEIVLREGLIFDYPQSTKVIPDRLCQSLVGFIGARHVSIEYLFKPDEIKEMFKVDLENGFKGYNPDGQRMDDSDDDSANRVGDVSEDIDDTAYAAPRAGRMNKAGLVCVWKHYDKPSGLVYYVADGYPKFLRPAAAPDVFTEDFWPLYALTFNAVESETDLFPPSDVSLLIDQQMEYNRSRQGMREHRKAARPRFVYANGALEAVDMELLGTAEPFTATAVNIPQGLGIADVLQTIPVPGVDPNLYETNQLFTDIQLIVGTQEAQLGGVAQATATESAIAASSSASSSGSSVDDLDAFLTMIARSSGQILLREMSEEQVKLVAGPGAVWPHMTLADIASEVFLEVEAGSTGKPNQAVELNAWERLLPFLIQIPGIDPVFLARETLRRADDRFDLNEAIAAGMPSIVMQNQMQQPGTGDPATDPATQGGEGGSNAPAPPGGEGGSAPAFGSNQV